ncbi:MAG TPA: hypothetical protein VNG04_09970, partial [Candidatus Acidoferrum sp.]|nr:hypothetical protein [Candidatus Acidoferrum sp.]
MRFGPVLMLPALLAVSCGGVPANASHSVSPSASPSAATAASPSSAPLAVPLSGSYGLLLSAGKLQLVSPDATVAAAVAVAPASAQFCSYQNDTLVAPPPVSASNDEVYFRDGDT